MTMSIMAFVPTLNATAVDIPHSGSSQEAVEIAPMAVIIHTLHATTAFPTATGIVGVGMVQRGTPVDFRGISGARAAVVPIAGDLIGRLVWICRNAVGR